MASNIPGRRISFGETLYTDWGPRGGDCALLRAQALIKSSTTGAIYISLETRSEEDTAAAAMDTWYPSVNPRLLAMDVVGVKTAIYVATVGSNATPRGFKEQVRFKIVFSSGAAGDYYVIRLFPLVFFDNSIPST